MARGLVLSIAKKSCKKIVARCTIGVRTVCSYAPNYLVGGCVYPKENSKNLKMKFGYALTPSLTYTTQIGTVLKNGSGMSLSHFNGTFVGFWSCSTKLASHYFMHFLYYHVLLVYSPLRKNRTYISIQTLLLYSSSEYIRSDTLEC